MKTITKYARWNRKNPTPAELALKKHLLKAHIRFRTQRMFDFYIVDFLIPDRWLIIELDGDSHRGREEYDKKRNEYLTDKGFTLLHFPNEVAIKTPEIIEAQILLVPKKERPRPWWILYGRSAY